MSLTEHAAYHAILGLYAGDFRKRDALYKKYASWSKTLASLQQNVSLAEREYKRLAQNHIRLILQQDKDFPALLREIPWAPHGIYLRGTMPTLDTCVAIVGTRRASPEGLRTAEDFAAKLAERSITIISGLAFGIDAAAHRGALSRKKQVIAVLASGVDNITPRTNEQLGLSIIKNGGAIISEYPPGTAPLPRYFIERNRIVAGLCQGVLVIEAPERSGTLSTARFAIEQNREVFVIPGSLYDQNFAGSHRLIQQGAQLVVSANDVLTALGIEDKKSSPQQLSFLDETSQRIVDVVRMAGGSLTADQIAERTALGVAVINEHLALLVIENVLNESGGGYCSAA